MKAMVLHKICDLGSEKSPLKLEQMDKPVPGDFEILIKVKTCGVCHTELDEIEGRTPPENLPVILGHQVVGIVEQAGKKAGLIKTGDRVGVAWIYSACGTCTYCLSGQENLCADFKATGRDAHGGYAEYMTVPEKFVYAIPGIFSDAEAAPLLCAGAIGYRSIRLSGIKNGDTLGLTGFGASAHLVLKMVNYSYPDTGVYVFARSETERRFALELGAVWAGDTTDRPPVLLKSIIDTTPVWKPVVEALACLAPGGRLVINAIRKEHYDSAVLMSLDYPVHLWMEKEIKSVANVTRDDVRQFLALAAKIPIKPEVELYELEEANKALLEIKDKKIRGAKVLRIS
ncbi:MAG: zinc-dependent alcohol dehydrogenase family protein [Bacteroidales bacterium]|nr:zinc-dependent alcohol dehydrogenase family protein [Bacteroidales bacterium]